MKKTLLAMASACVLAACSSPNSQAPTELQDYQSLAEPEVVWSKSVGESLTNFLTPAVVGQTTYVAGDNSVYRLDTADGNEVWRYETEAPIAAGVGSDGYVVAVGTEKGELVVISAEGQKLWSWVGYCAHGRYPCDGF